MKKIFLYILILVISIFCSLIILSNRNNNENTFEQKTKENYVFINNQKILVEIADSDEERRQGLSNKDYLAENSGMLFVFNPKSMASFWMKDMKFAIDIIWIKENLIIKIDKAVPAPYPNTPISELKHYLPPSEIDYVLEVNSGFSDRSNIKIGDRVDISIKLKPGE